MRVYCVRVYCNEGGVFASYCEFCADVYTQIMKSHSSPPPPHTPQDILAISFLFSSCIAIGEMEKMRDSLARVLPWWTEDMALYPHILSL